MVTPYLIFDVEVCPGLTENLNDAREAVPGGDVQTGLFVLRKCVAGDADDRKCDYRDGDDGDGDDRIGHDGDGDDTKKKRKRQKKKKTHSILKVNVCMYGDEILDHGGVTIFTTRV